MKGFINTDIYVEGKGVIKTNLAIDNDKIAYIGDDATKISEPINVPDGAVIVPGFIDQHVHGAAGSDAMDGTAKDLENIALALASEGTTSFLATTMTQSKENILKAMSAVKDYKSLSPDTGARVLGIHLEGPFISLKHIGAQPKEYVVSPDVDLFNEYNSASGNAIKVVSLAPEETGADELIAHLDKNGIVASAGHTDAGYCDIEKAIKSGLKNVTHTYNAQKGVHHREIGTVGSAMTFDELSCEMICDLIHLSAPAIKLLIKNKPHDKITLITDSMRAKHLDDGISELGGQKVIVKNGEARLENGALAGSILKMNDAVKNVVNACGVSFTDAVDYATANPAKNLGVFDTIGSIKVGKIADFAVLNKDFTVYMTIRDGKVVYKAQ
ncbi:MAG: N-acetylglucosamine-6-phosphate deacetylase [Clostridia bacterium]|nr:N-acetylglucosamine-6-phosphate deacetylase [Clostridia bacterium]